MLPPTGSRPILQPVDKVGWDEAKHARGWHGRFTHRLGHAAITPRLTSRKQAEDYIRGLGVEDVDLAGIKYPDSWQGIANATHDAMTRFPSLRGGFQGKLAGVVTWGSLGPEDKVVHGVDMKEYMSRDGGTATWGLTGSNPHTSLARPFDYSGPGGHGIPGVVQAERDQMDSVFGAGELDPADPPGTAGPDTWIVINDKAENHPKHMIGAAKEGILAAPNTTTYGRMMHELGHAVAATDGLSLTTTLGEGAPLDDGGLNPRVLREVSWYAASDMSEAWAETFTVANTPGMLTHMSTEIQDGVAKIRAKYNHGGRVIL